MAKFILPIIALIATAVSVDASLVSCTAEKLTDAMKACDSLVNISQLKCDDKACHNALHVLVDPDYIQCYEDLKLGKKKDLVKYKELDDFCHGEAPDPLEKEGANPTMAPGSMAASEEDDDSDNTVTTPPPSSSSPVPSATSSATGSLTVLSATSAVALIGTLLSFF